MATTVRTKVQKKQSPFPAPPADSEAARRLEQAVAALEDTVFYVLNADKGHAFHDVDFLYWNRKLKNVAMQISMALNERSGPRKFHHHYRHDPKDFDTLYPVAGPAPMDTLARVAREGLSECVEMVGLQDDHVKRHRDRLEQSLRTFLQRYQARLKSV